MKAKVSGTKKKINGTTFLLMITILLFVVMYAAGMIVFNDKGFAKPQMFLNLFISNAGLLVIAMGETIVMITAGIDISVGSVTALVCMVAANQMENHGASAYTALLMALVIGLLFGLVQGFLVSYLEIQPFIVTLAGMFFGRGMTSIISTDMISIKNATFMAWAKYKIYMPFGSYSKTGKFLTFFLLQCILDIFGQCLVLRNSDILQSIGTFLSFLDIGCKADGCIFHHGQADGQLFYLFKGSLGFVQRHLCAVVGIGGSVSGFVIFHQRNFRTHNTSGFNAYRVLDRNRTRDLLDKGDTNLHIGFLQCCIGSAESHINLCLDILCLIDQLHHFTNQDVTLLVHQLIALTGKLQ